MKSMHMVNRGTVASASSTGRHSALPRCNVARPSVRASYANDVGPNTANMGANTAQAGLAFNPRNETPEQARERRLRESRQYEEHSTMIAGLADWKTNLDAAGKNLVVVEVSRSRSAQHCLVPCKRDVALLHACMHPV
jgi:hypothetical protein